MRTRSPLKARDVNSCAPEGLAVLAPLVTLVLEIILDASIEIYIYPITNDISSLNLSDIDIETTLRFFFFFLFCYQ